MRLWPLSAGPRLALRRRVTPFTLARFVSIVVLGCRTARRSNRSGAVGFNSFFGPSSYPSASPAGQSAAAAADDDGRCSWRNRTIASSRSRRRCGFRDTDPISSSRTASTATSGTATSVFRPATCSASIRAQSSASSIASGSCGMWRRPFTAPRSTRPFSSTASTTPCIRPPRRRSRSQDWCPSRDRTTFRIDIHPLWAPSSPEPSRDWLALYAAPIWVHNTAAILNIDRDTFYVGVGGRLRLRPTVYVVAETSPRVAGYDPGETDFAFGIEKTRRRSHVSAELRERSGHDVRADSAGRKSARAVYGIQPRKKVLLTHKETSTHETISQ